MEETMEQARNDEDQEGRTAPPDADTAPAAQPSCPQPSITGAQTGALQDHSETVGFLFSVDWLAFTVPLCTGKEAQDCVGENGFSWKRALMAIRGLGSA